MTKCASVPVIGIRDGIETLIRTECPDNEFKSHCTGDFSNIDREILELFMYEEELSNNNGEV